MAEQPDTALPIEDYALIGDTRTAALVGRDGSIDWLCLPRFDSGACFARLLGTSENGRWCVAPDQPLRQVRRRYRPETLILETDFETDTGEVRVIDFMPPPSHAGEVDLIRVVQGLRGTVRMCSELVLRFDYGRIVPWVRRHPFGLDAVAGPDTVQFRTPVPLHGENFRTVGAFEVKEGENVPFALSWFPAFDFQHEPGDPFELLKITERWWRGWSDRCTKEGDLREPVLRSLITLKALTYSPTGAIVAAPTTSLPEHLGGTRNWDYRFCWLRDATFTLYALLISGYTDEAKSWREWLLRAVAGDPSQLQIMYGLSGERRLPELELPWLNGYENSRPVRVGNAAHQQFQLDVYGELMDAMHVGRKNNLEHDDNAWRVQKELVRFVEQVWQNPDEGIWEIRGPKRHFTHSRVMAWVAMDRAVKSVERFGLSGPVEQWRKLRDQIHAEVCERGFDPKLGTFVQAYGERELDAALLMMALVGFLPPDDPRIVGTVEAIERNLSDNGLVLRYRTRESIDGLPPGEGAFLACTFWLADNYAMMGRYEHAQEIFDRLLSLRNDVGLLAEEYDCRNRRQLGNFPQAFSHVALINTASNLQRRYGPAEVRAKN